MVCKVVCGGYCEMDSVCCVVFGVRWCVGDVVRWIVCVVWCLV